jgi:uncharacterized protein YndB with AHSA1/START domain
MQNEKDKAAVKELIITRTFNAPIKLVFDTITKAEHLAHWWGPKNAKVTVINLDLKKGGKFHYCMDAGEFKMYGIFVYHDIQPNEYLSFVNSFSDDKGNIIRAPFSATWPLEVMNHWSLSEKDGMTTLIAKGMPYNATSEEHATFEAMFEGMNEGFKGTFDQLADYLTTL